MCESRRKSGTEVSVSLRTEQRGARLLVEEVVVHFDLGAGFEIVWQQHDRYRHLAQVINLHMINGSGKMNSHAQTHTHTHVHSLRFTLQEANKKDSKCQMYR